MVATGLMPAGARTVAEKLGIPYVLVAFHPGVLPSPHQPPLPRPGKPFPSGVTDNRVLWEVDAERVQALYGEPLNAHRAALGLPPVDNVRDHVFTDRPWLAADPILARGAVRRTSTSCRPARGSCPTNAHFRPTGGVPGRRRTAGVRGLRQHACPARTSPGWPSRRSARRAAASLVGRGWADLALIDDRDDCFVVGEVNQQALFRRVAAVVHHGGAGTTTTAARAGAPQVVVPQIADQPYWAGRVAELGIGAAHDGPTPTVESLSAALETALAPETRARAAAVAGTIRTDGAAVAAKLLIDAISHERRAV